MNLKDEEVRVKTRWRPSTVEPSSTVRRLWHKLLDRKKEKPANTRQDGGDGGKS